MTQQTTPFSGSADRIGLPRKLVLIFHQFHDGMIVCIPLDNGKCSDWFSVDQDLRQECVLAPLLFVIDLAVMMSVIYKRFDADDAVRHDLVRIK